MVAQSQEEVVDAWASRLVVWEGYRGTTSWQTEVLEGVGTMTGMLVLKVADAECLQVERSRV